MKFQLLPNSKKVTEKQLIADLRRVSREHKLDIVTERQYARYGKFSQSAIFKRFGSWVNAQGAAGLEKTRHDYVSGKDLFKNLKKVWTQLGRQPKLREMRKPLSKYNASVYVNIFGTWWRALEWFVRIVNTGLFDREEILPMELRKKYKQYQKRGRWISLRLRFEVFRRDGYRCRLCGRSPMKHKNTVLHIDHIKPLVRGGRTVKDNLRTLCSDCNVGKGDRG